MKLLAWARTNWQWWLVLSFVILLPTKNVFNLPVGIMSVIGLVMLVRRDPTLPCRSALVLLFTVFDCMWIPMLFAVPGATNFEHSALTSLKFLHFPFMGVFMLVAARNERSRTYLIWGVFFVLVFWCVDGLWQFIVGWNFFG